MATDKTETMPMNKKRLPEDFNIKVGTSVIEPKKSIKYLGIYLGRGRSFHEHIVYTTNKAIKTMAALARIMPNSLKLKQKNRKLYYNVAESIVFYMLRRSGLIKVPPTQILIY